VEYFFYGRGRPGTEALAEELAEAHWSFMDRYAEQMIARGPTLTPDRTTWTGSMHMVDLADAQAARVFAFQEPFWRAGVYDQVLVRRWGNALGRTMWDYPFELGGDRRFLVIGHGKPGAAAARQALGAAQRRWVGEPGHRHGVILCGPLLADDGVGWVGSALLVQLGDRAAVEAMVAGASYVQAGLYASVEVHDWQFGGRPQSSLRLGVGPWRLHRCAQHLDPLGGVYRNRFQRRSPLVGR
jgi:uncharacterized protein YciI